MRKQGLLAVGSHLGNLASNVEVFADVHGGDGINGHVAEYAQEVPKFLVVVEPGAYRLRGVHLAHVAPGDDRKQPGRFIFPHAFTLSPQPKRFGTII